MATSARVLTPADLYHVLEFVAGGGTPVRNTCIIHLSFDTGLRACEIAGLEWPMVSTARGSAGSQIALNGNIAKNGHQRFIPLQPTLADSLRQLHRIGRKPTTGPGIRSRRGAADT